MFSNWFKVQPAALRRKRQRTMILGNILAHRENIICDERENIDVRAGRCFAKSSRGSKQQPASQMWQPAFCRPWQNESDGCFDPARDLTYSHFISEHMHNTSPLAHKKPLNTLVFISKDWTAKPLKQVPQSHLSQAGCDVITNCCMSAHLLWSRSSRICQPNAVERKRKKKPFFPSVWEMYCRVFTLHSFASAPPAAE